MTRRRSDIIRELANRERAVEDFRLAAEDVYVRRSKIPLRTVAWVLLDQEFATICKAIVDAEEMRDGLESELGYVRREG